LIETGRRQREAVGYFENGEYDKAETVLKQAKKKLLTLGSSLSSDSELLNNQLEALEVEREQYSAAEAAPAAVQSLITKGAKNRVYQSSKGKKSIYLLKPGTNGFEVENLQRALKEQKLYAGDIDGNFDDEVEEALRELQRNEGLTADGIAGPRTLKSLGLY
jgi:peptidoglycan hydrolase-like protein with peptidoglycan-binding domain